MKNQKGSATIGIVAGTLIITGLIVWLVIAIENSGVSKAEKIQRQEMSNQVTIKTLQGWVTIACVEGYKFAKSNESLVQILDEQHNGIRCK